MSDANTAQYDWPCNALPCFKLATGGRDAKTQANSLSQNVVLGCLRPLHNSLH